MSQIVSKQILPAAIQYTDVLLQSAAHKAAAGLQAIAENELAARITELTNSAYATLARLNANAVAAKDVSDVLAAARNYHDAVFLTMQELRVSCDELETVVAREYWPFPTYGDLMYY